MRAVIAQQPGPPDVLRAIDLPDPESGPGRVVVEVAAAAITFIDTQLRSGSAPRPMSFPVVLGNGVVGTVVAIGDGVDRSWLGVEVVTTTGGHGGYSTRAIAAVSDLHRIPKGLDSNDALALLADGRTAIGLCRASRLEAGDTVAITAAAGGVGSLLVQLARNAGAKVIALAGSNKLDHARKQGAAVAVDYRNDGWIRELDAAAPAGLDVVFDGVGGAISRPLFERIRAGGRYLPHGKASGRWGDVDEELAASRTVTVVPLAAIGASAAEMYELVEEALHQAVAGNIHPTIGQTFPLEEAARAHAALEARSTVGKTLLIASRIVQGR